MSDTSPRLSQEEALELQRIRIRQDMQDEITTWAKKRFAMLGLVGAVLGFFGLSTVMHQSLQMLVTTPVERELAKLDAAKERANQVTAELIVLSSEVEENGRRAQQAAADAATKIAQLESSIKSGTREAAEIRSQFGSIRSSMSRVSDNIFELASGITENEKHLEVEVWKASRSLAAIQQLSTSVAESFPSTQVEMALKQFQSDVSQINADYVSEYNRINQIRSFNIVYYVDQADNDQTAQAIVRELKSEGYRAAVWYAQGKSRDDIIEEISSEFGDIEDILKANPKGMVSDPAHQDITGNIEKLLSSQFQFKDTALVKRPLQPAPMHLVHGEDAKPFAADRIILIYSLDARGS